MDKGNCEIVLRELLKEVDKIKFEIAVKKGVLVRLKEISDSIEAELLIEQARRDSIYVKHEHSQDADISGGGLND